MAENETKNEKKRIRKNERNKDPRDHLIQKRKFSVKMNH